MEQEGNIVGYAGGVGWWMLAGKRGRSAIGIEVNWRTER